MLEKFLACVCWTIIIVILLSIYLIHFENVSISVTSSFVKQEIKLFFLKHKFITKQNQTLFITREETQVLEKDSECLLMEKLTYNDTISAIDQLSHYSISQYFKQENWKDRIWLSYIGDSLVRSIFYEIIHQTKGKEWLNQIMTFYPDDFMQVYHKDHLYCCSTPHDCFLKIFQVERKEEYQEPFEYLNDYKGGIESWIKNIYKNNTKAFCASWRWNKFPGKPLNQILNSQIPLQPSLIVINPFAHALLQNWDVKEYEKAYKETFKHIGKYLNQSDSLFIVHNGAMTNMTLLSENRKKTMTAERVSLFNQALEKSFHSFIANDNNSPDRVKLLNVYNLTSKGDVVPSTDGVHYFGHYQAIMLNLHYNLLKATTQINFCS